MARQEQFKLENLKMLDFGVIGAAFDAEMMRVIKDCSDRPLDDKPRTVSITFNVTPKPDLSRANGVVDCEKVSVECDITSKVPPRRTKIYEMTPRQDGTAVFHPDLPDEPDGDTLYDKDAERQDHQGK